jgi:hypothetical protein
MKKIPANTNSIWLPNERWIAPSAEDRELVRKVVADADARIAAEHAHTTQAELDTYNAKQAAAHDMLDALPQQRDWLHTAGTALCLLPVISILLILLFRTGS